MSFQFILGSGTSDFESELAAQSIEWLKQDDNNEVFYLVPNHIKFETEISVLKKIKKFQNNERPNFSSMKLQVFSFTRLAWYYLQNSKNYSPEILNESSIAMILKKILSDCETDLSVYRGEIHHAGFIESLGKLFNEFFQGNINSLDLVNIINTLGSTSQEIDLKHKLADLELLYTNYSDYLVHHELRPVQLLSQLVDYLQTNNLKNVMFIVSGFSRFTVDESMLIECLIKNAGELRLSMVLDKSYYDRQPEPNNLFFNSGKTYFNFYQLARNNSIQILADKKIKDDKTVSSEGIMQLDDYWKNLYSFKNVDINQVDTNENIKIWQAASSTAEVVGIAKEIHHLVATSDIRYKDIRILSRDIPYYRMIISPIFSKNNLPVSFEDEIKMTHHPLVVLIQSLFLIKKNYFKYKDIFRFLRTRLFMPTISGEETLNEYEKKEEIYQDKIDITENIVLAYGYEGKRWEQLNDWLYVPQSLNETMSNDSLLERQKISNEIRNDIRCSLIPLFKSLDTCKKGKDAAVCLYNFLINSKIDKILLYWRNSDIEKGLLDDARIHEQAWQELIQLLDDYVTIFGEDPFKLDEFSAIFSTGLENTTYSKVPTTIDQIAVSSLDTIHGEKKKITFIVGLTETILPMKSVNSTLLTDDERITLDSLLPEGNYIQQTAQQTMIQEPFVAYMAFMSCSEKLYLSYPIVTDQNKSTKPSPYVENIKMKFNIELEMKYNHPSMDTNSLKEISTSRQLVSDIITVMRESKDEHSELSPFWEYLLRLAKESSEVNKSISHVLQSLSVLNIPQTLSSNITDSLYGSTLYTSVSQIENFYNCEYKYLLKYGLRLYEREKFELNPMITGNFFHETLDRIIKYILANNLNLASISEKELFKCVNSVINEVCEEPHFGILSASARMQFIRYLLTSTVQRVCWAFKKQSERSKIHTLQTELIFGNDLQTGGLNGLNFKINNEKSIKVRGKIDRLDTIQIDSTPFFSIVDYKSSNHKFDFRDVYYGLAMQMITYLDVALNNSHSIIGKIAEPSGAFYLHINDPVIKPNEIGENIDLTLLNSYRYNGILLNNEELLNEMDTTIEEKQSSIVFPFRRLANGSATSSQFVTKDDINNLRKHTHKKYEEAGSKIFSGSNQLNPAYQDKTRIACQNCEYRSICQFDVLLKENNYARIDKIKKDDVLKKINDENIGGTSNE